MSSKLKCASVLPSALLTAVLAGCGGGGGDAAFSDSARDCFNDQLVQPGVEYAVTHEVDYSTAPGPIVSVRTITKVSSTSFLGQSGLLAVETFRERAGQRIPLNNFIVSYEGKIEVIHGLQLVNPTTGAYRGYVRYDPPLRDARFILRPGESTQMGENITWSQFDADGNLVATGLLNPRDWSNFFITFVGKETSKVKGGSFETCHFTSGAYSNDLWYARSLGVLVKSSPYDKRQLESFEMLVQPSRP